MVGQRRGGGYGGSARLKNEASPWRIVLESPHDTKNVMIIPMITTPTTDTEETRPEREGRTSAPTKIVAMRICVGHRPLQIAKLFVRIAMRRSRGLSMIRVEMIAAALQPYPMAIVSACFPCAPAFRNMLSRLNATRGR